LTISEKKPEARCGIVRNGVRTAEQLDSAIKKTILDRYPQSFLQTAINTKETDWLPLEYATTFFECVNQSFPMRNIIHSVYKATNA